MKAIALGLIMLIPMAQGCSIYKAATAPPPVAVDMVKVGSTRVDALSVFGAPKQTEVSEGGQRTDVFEFTDGNPGASKARIIPYIAGDFFTLGLAELVFWPLELALLQGSEGRAIATYGPDNHIQTIKVTKKDGTPWEYAKGVPETVVHIE